MEFWAQTTFDLQNTFKEFDCNTLESTEYTELDHVHIVFYLILQYINITAEKNMNTKRFCKFCSIKSNCYHPIAFYFPWELIVYRLCATCSYCFLFMIGTNLDLIKWLNKNNGFINQFCKFCSIKSKCHHPTPMGIGCLLVVCKVFILFSFHLLRYFNRIEETIWTQNNFPTCLFLFFLNPKGFDWLCATCSYCFLFT